MAVWRDLIFASIGKRRSVIGMNEIA